MNKIDLNKSYLYNSILKMLVELNLSKIVQKNQKEKFIDVVDQQKYLKKMFYIKIYKLMFNFINHKNYSNLRFKLQNFNVDFQNSIIDFTVGLENRENNKIYILNFYKEFNEKSFI